ncbi:CaiB/BaiF CoA-transferase family protein [Amycolatopsis sp. GM8]|uniref:CaiB/BaiF CoA transferase family protein n=1 Tax=Amycolatopsis sp. GM8 TaxID=2896530 RepID=UPI001F17E923|nr:CoA transferase [Amycolatopsis sp. GM8]
MSDPAGNPRQSRPLDGIRVLDLTSGIAGPIAAMHLADFGADVLKIEPPAGDPDRSRPGFAMWNRNKRSVVIDPADAEDRARLEEFIGCADVLVTSGTEGPFARIRAPERARAGNPGLVHLHLPAFLRDHRWAGDGESAGLVWALSGMCFRQSSFDGTPVDNAFPWVLYLQGAWAAAAATAALIERHTSGEGQLVTAGGLHATMVAYAYLIDPSVPEVPANYGPGGLNPMYTRYQCADGRWILLATLTSKFQRQALEVLGLTDILADERVGDDLETFRLPVNRTWIRRRLANRFATRTSAEWLDALGKADVPVGPLLERDDWFDSPLLGPIGARLEIDDPERGRVVMPASPVNLTGTPADIRRPAPRLGEHTESVEHWAPRPEPARRLDAVSGSGPLAGVRVLDLGTVLAGPFTGTLLADLGADVIKVEIPAGDDFRHRGMPYIRGQRCIAIDLKSPDGHAAFLRLAETADVVVDNYRAGVLARLKIDYEHLREVNPDIISLSITGYGEGHAFSAQPAFDPLLQALSGMMTAQGGDSEPVMGIVGINDVESAALSVLGSLLALFHRLRGGRGQRVWLSLAGTSTYSQCEEIIRMEGRTPAGVGGRDFRGPGPADCFYETKDGWIRIQTREDALIGAGILDGNHASNDDLGIRLTASFLALTRDEAISKLDAAGIPAVPARRQRELIEDPEYKALNVFDPMDTADGKHIFVPGRYTRFSRSQHDRVLTPPGVGEHSTDVLREAGFSEEEITALLDANVVRQGIPMRYRTLTAYR